MIVLAIASAVYVAALQTAAADASRKAFTACLREAVEKGISEKVAVDGFTAYLQTQCAPITAIFKSSMVSFDIKNKVPRKQATSDAESQINDYYTETADRYKFQAQPPGKSQ